MLRRLGIVLQLPFLGPASAQLDRGTRNVTAWWQHEAIIMEKR
jgi:hypothetical protein